MMNMQKLQAFTKYLRQTLFYILREAEHVTHEATRIYHVYNHASFCMWWKENLVKYLKVSKHHEYGCRFKRIVGVKYKNSIRT